MCVDAQHDVQVVAQQRCTSFRFERKCVMAFACEAEMSEMKACLHRCALWKAHQGLLNGTVEQLCPISFLSELTDKNACRCAMHER